MNSTKPFPFFLPGFFSNFSRPAPTTILPVSGHAPPNLRARPHKRRGADNPPPYDDPPPYHIAISMSEALGSSDLEEDSIELEEDAIATEAVKAEEVVPSIPERPGVVV